MAILVAVVAVGGIILNEVFRPQYPLNVRVTQYRYKQMADPAYIEKLKDYAYHNLSDPINLLDWKELVEWTRRHLYYTRSRLAEPRPELPIDILERKWGRCGEFSLLYNGLLLAQGYESRIIDDCSHRVDIRKAGDHVWVEVRVGDNWIHVDPTENIIDNPNVYADNWNKTVNQVYAVTADEIIDVTETYQGVM